VQLDEVLQFFSGPAQPVTTQKQRTAAR
jgi:hypothetical protein